MSNTGEKGFKLTKFNIKNIKENIRKETGGATTINIIKFFGKNGKKPRCYGISKLIDSKYVELDDNKEYYTTEVFLQCFLTSESKDADLHSDVKRGKKNECIIPLTCIEEIKNEINKKKFYPPYNKSTDSTTQKDQNKSQDSSSQSSTRDNNKGENKRERDLSSNKNYDNSSSDSSFRVNSRKNVSNSQSNKNNNVNRKERSGNDRPRRERDDNKKAYDGAFIIGSKTIESRNWKEGDQSRQRYKKNDDIKKSDSKILLKPFDAKLDNKIEEKKLSEDQNILTAKIPIIDPSPDQNIENEDNENEIYEISETSQDTNNIDSHDKKNIIFDEVEKKSNNNMNNDFGSDSEPDEFEAEATSVDYKPIEYVTQERFNKYGADSSTLTRSQFDKLKGKEAIVYSEDLYTIKVNNLNEDSAINYNAKSNISLNKNTRTIPTISRRNTYGNEANVSSNNNYNKVPNQNSDETVIVNDLDNNKSEPIATYADNLKTKTDAVVNQITNVEQTNIIKTEQTLNETSLTEISDSNLIALEPAPITAQVVDIKPILSFQSSPDSKEKEIIRVIGEQKQETEEKEKEKEILIVLKQRDLTKPIEVEEEEFDFFSNSPQ